MCDLQGAWSSDSSSIGEQRDQLITIDAKKHWRSVIVANSLAASGVKNKIKQG